MGASESPEPAGGASDALVDRQNPTEVLVPWRPKRRRQEPDFLQATAAATAEAQAATSEAAAAAALVRKAKAEEGIVRCQHFLHTSTVCFGTNGTVRTVL